MRAHSCSMWDLVPWPGIEPRHWEHEVLATGPSRKPPTERLFLHSFVPSTSLSRLPSNSFLQRGHEQLQRRSCHQCTHLWERRSNTECLWGCQPSPCLQAVYILGTPDGVLFQGLALCSLMSSDGVSLRESQPLSASRPLQIWRTARNKWRLFQIAALQTTHQTYGSERGFFPAEADRPSWQFPPYKIQFNFAPHFFFFCTTFWMKWSDLCYSNTIYF